MKKLALPLTALALTFGASANSIVTKAEVVDSAPIVETVYEPVESCRYEYRDTRGARGGDKTGDKVLGGILGGAAGSAVGKGSGRDAAAAVGVLLGSEIAAQDGGLTSGELIGGIAGGVIGNQVGKGGGKTAATAIGTLVGSIVGDNLQNGDRRGAGAKKKVRVCTTAERAKKVITGYDVTFEFAGIRSSGVVSYKPGRFVDVNVEIEILEDRTSAVYSE